jgi:poly(3-hydroxybutyrate) depolymerase
MSRLGYRLTFCWLAIVLSLLSGCAKKTDVREADHPRLTAGVTMRDITFYSPALNREMQYRVILPASVPLGKKLMAVYLLHGGGGGFRDWSNNSDVARFAEHGLILVMPEGNYSYYTNSVNVPKIVTRITSRTISFPMFKVSSLWRRVAIIARLLVCQWVVSAQ